MVLLDTDLMSLLEREGTEAQRLRMRLAIVPLDDLATTIISYEEQTRGWLSYMAQARTEEARIEAYVRMQNHLRLYCKIPIVAYDARAAPEYERLRQAKIRIGTMDLKIAAIALANNALLLTRNVSHFSKVPNLRFEDGTA